MNLVESIASAYKTLVHNKVRSFLTMLGIVIGIMSVIVVMSLGDSAQGLILNEVKTLGSNLIIIMPGKTDPKGPPSTLFGNVVTTLKYKDATQILKANNPHIESVCAYVQGTDVISWSDNNPILTFKGVMSTYIEAEGAKLQAGRFFTEEEDNSNARVIVLGSKAAKDIFGEQDPLGEKVKIRKVNFTVIGVLAERGGGLAQTQDKEVFVPLKTAQNFLLGIDYVSSIRVKVDKSENINDTIMYIEDVLRRSHNIHNPDDDDFTVRSSETAIEAIAQITSAVQFFLVAIASISLLVGGFGIMNIMLATVQERTKEIGLRKAVGAKNSDIIWQFLIETSFITLVAGVIGIILGALISWLVAVVAQFFGLQWDFIVSPISIFGMFCFY